MTVDQVVLALTIWRENRGGQYPGMQSVANVVTNRAKARNTSAYVECVRPWQFSSMTAHGDPELSLWPPPGDKQWIMAQEIAGLAVAGTLEDLTGGATFYYAASMTVPPKWAETMKKTAEVAGHIFFSN